MAAPGSLLPSPAQWRELRTAWLERRSNPVLHYFRVARQRRRAALPWWRRNLPLLPGLAAAGAAAYSAYRSNFRPLLGMYGPASGPVEHAVNALLSGLGVALAAWLLQGLFDALVSAACVLSRPGRRRLDLQIDAPLLASRLNSAELLVGSALPLLELLLPRIAAAAAASLALTIAASALDWPTAPTARSLAADIAGSGQSGLATLALALDSAFPAWQQSAALAPASLCAMLLSGALAAAALLLLALCAGRGQRMDVHSGVLASVLCLSALGFALLTQLATIMFREQYGPAGMLGKDLPLAAIEPLPFMLWLGGLLAYALLAVRRSAAGLRLALPYSLPLLFIASTAGLIQLTESNTVTGDPTHFFFDWIMCWSCFAPVSAVALPHPACFGSGLRELALHPAPEQFRWLLLVLAQAALVSGLLRAGLDSIAAAREAAQE